MMELPEALNLADQLNKTISGKKIAGVTAGFTPHKLAWYYGDRAQYSQLLNGKTIGKAAPVGGMVEVKAGSANILLGEGAAIRFHEKNSSRPPKHQFLLEFEDGTALSAAVQMFGGMGAFLEGGLDNPYYKPSPFSAAFDAAYFANLISAEEVQKLSLKAFLATEQRVPGLGNGVLQDILYNAGMHPKKKVSSLSTQDRELLFKSVKSTLEAMAEKGGRDTETDLFGRPGGCRTILSKNTVNKPCAVCGTNIKKEAYLGGAIYYCEKCQRV
jgi:formamidopyrimidine-DNA glycosylase